MRKNNQNIKGFGAFTGLVRTFWGGQINRKKGGFTLIEVLLVVLIIGILTSIALPQYQKAVVKARNANFKQDIMKIARAQEMYFETFNKYAESFSDLDVNISLPSTNDDPCTISHNGNDAMRATEDYYIVLNGPAITGAYHKGDYRCTGFSFVMEIPALGESVSHTLMCVEKGDAPKGNGGFCEKLEHASLVGTAGSWNWYSL